MEILLTQRGRAVLAPLFGLFLVMLILWANKNHQAAVRQTIGASAITGEITCVNASISPGGNWHLDLLPDLTPFLYRANGGDIEYLVRSGTSWRYEGTGIETLQHLRTLYDGNQSNAWWFVPSILAVFAAVVLTVNYDLIIRKDRPADSASNKSSSKEVEEAVAVQKQVMKQT